MLFFHHFNTLGLKKLCKYSFTLFDFILKLLCDFLFMGRQIIQSSICILHIGFVIKFESTGRKMRKEKLVFLTLAFPVDYTLVENNVKSAFVLKRIFPVLGLVVIFVD